MSGLFRLCCFLLTLLLALPAVQASACGPEMGHITARMTAMSHGGDQHGGHHAPAPAPAETHHECLGCIAPIDLDTYRPVERLSFAIDRLDRSTNVAFFAGLGAPPEPPPPRFSA